MQKRGTHYLIFFVFLSLSLISCATNQKNLKAKEFSQEHYNLGMYFLERGYVYSAENELLSAIRLDPENPKIHLALARAFYLQKKFFLAKAGFEKTLQLDPNLSEAHFYLGILYVQSKEWDKALKEFNKAKSEKDFVYLPHINNNIGLIYYEKGMFSEAVKEFQTAIKGRSDFAHAHYNLGLVYERMGKDQEAIEKYQDAIKCFPRYVDAYKRIGRLYNKLGEKEKAEEAFKKAVEIAPKGKSAGTSRKYLEGQEQN